MFTKYFLDTISGNTFGTQTTPPLPSEYWLGLSSTEADSNGNGVTEPSTVGTGYGRVFLNPADLSAPVNGVTTNVNEILFDISTADWGRMYFSPIYDSEVGGNLLISSELEKSRLIEEETLMLLKPGALKLMIKNPSHFVLFCDENGEKVLGIIEEVEYEGYIDPVDIPTDPTKSGYTFQGWGLSQNGAIADLTTLKIKNHTLLYAVFA